MSEPMEELPPTDEDIAWYVQAVYVCCPDCSGYGEFWRQNFGWNALESHTFLGICLTCQGTGEPIFEGV